jgi:hypothetical protein
MKATITILAAVLALQVNVLCAANDGLLAPVTNSNMANSLAPVTPMEATFEDVAIISLVT